MAIDPSINSLLEGGGKSISWDGAPVGKTVKGTIKSAKQVQQTDYVTRKPKFYEDGNPMMQIAITMDTDERDSDIEDDDGVRTLYVRGQMLKALRDALKAAKVPTIEEQGVLRVRLKGEEPSGKGNPKKIFEAKYEPAPKVAVGAAEAWGDEEAPF